MKRNSGLKPDSSAKKKSQKKSAQRTTDLELISKFEEMVKEMRLNNADSEALKEFQSIAREKKKEYTKKKNKQQRKQKAKNIRAFKKQLRQKNPVNDLSFFQKLEVEEQKEVLKNVEEINNMITVDKPYRLKLLESDMPASFKAAANSFKVSNAPGAPPIRLSICVVT